MTSEIVESFQRIVRDTPARPLIFLPASDTALTATDVLAAATAVCDQLDDAHINPRGLIVAALGNRPSYLATFLACRLRQQPLCPVDAGTTAAEIDAIATKLGACAVLTSNASAGTTASLGMTIAKPAIDPGDSRHGPAVLLKLTSGSTGAPRATLTTEPVLTADSRILMSAMGVGADDTQMAAIPLSHAYGIGNLVVPLFTQGTALVLRDTFVPQRLPDDARRFRARVYPGVPFMFDHFVNNPPEGGWPGTLRNLLSAGAALDPNTAEQFRRRFGVKIHPFYGTSETGGITYDGSDNPAADGMVGTPLPGVSVELVAQDGAPDGGGRVLVRGPAVITSYADAVDAESFVDGGFLTGDLGVIDTAGQLTLSGRISSFVNVAGRKVQPDEVERVLRTLAGVTEARVLGVPDERRGEQLVAAMVMNGARPSVLTLRQFCGAQLASYKIPRAFVFLDAIPLTERGKIDRVRLRDMVCRAMSVQTDML
jgi:long-chain acyl-CoA synthetase